MCERYWLAIPKKCKVKDRRGAALRVHDSSNLAFSPTKSDKPFLVFRAEKHDFP
jgi:hypothetical protein